MDVEDIRRLYRIEDVLHLEKGKMARCPFHEDSHPSLSIYMKDGIQKWRCHVCNIQGDVIDLVGYQTIPGYNGRGHRKQAAENLSWNSSIEVNPIVDIPKTPKLSDYAWSDFTPMTDNIREYCHSRGITDSLIDKYKLGSCSRMLENKPQKEGNEYLLSLPAFTCGSLMTIKLRNLKSNGKRFRYWSVQGSRSSLFNHDEVYHTTDTVIICKGEIAAMVVEGFTGMLTCAPTNGEAGNLDYLVTNALEFSKNVVIGDNDEVGTRSAIQRGKILRAKVIFPPKEFKDVDEWLLARPSAKDELNDAVRNLW